MAPHRWIAPVVVVAVLAPALAPATGLITGTLAGLIRGPRKGLIAVVRAVDVETAGLTAMLRLRKAKKFRLRVPAVPTMVLVDVTNVRTDATATGMSGLLRPVERKRVKTKVSLAPRFAPGTWNVGVPRTNFTATGPGFGTAEANGEADMTLVDLAGSPCYGDGKRFVITETDPRILEARQREIDLSNSEYADPATRLVDRYVPPDKLVSGSVVSDGTSVTVSLVLKDSGGGTLATGSATGPADQWFEVHNKAAAALASDICKDGSVRLTDAACPSTACVCCADPSALCQGVTWTERMSGTATGPVGTIVHVDFPTIVGGTLTCPGWTPTTCTANLACCRRESADQPETITFEATLPIPPGGACVCPKPPATDTSLLAQVILPDAPGDEDQRIVGCPGN